MVTGKTASGFEFAIDPEAIDDFEVLEALANVSKGEVLDLPFVVEKILGKEQKKRLYDHLRNKQGRVPVKQTSEEIVEIFKAAGEKSKNS